MGSGGQLSAASYPLGSAQGQWEPGGVTERLDVDTFLSPAVVIVWCLSLSLSASNTGFSVCLWLYFPTVSPPASTQIFGMGSTSATPDSVSLVGSWANSEMTLTVAIANTLAPIGVVVLPMLRWSAHQATPGGSREAVG